MFFEPDAAIVERVKPSPARQGVTDGLGKFDLLTDLTKLPLATVQGRMPERLFMLLDSNVC